MKFTLKEALKFGWKGLSGFAYSSKEDFKNASVAYFELTSYHGKVKTTLSDRIYYVIDGKGKFIIEGKKISVEKVDVILVPKNTYYDYKTITKVLRLFLVHIPAYDPKFEVKPK